MKTLSFVLCMVLGMTFGLALLGSAFWVSQNVPGWILGLLAFATWGLAGASDWYNPKNRASINVGSFMVYFWSTIAFWRVGDGVGFVIWWAVVIAIFTTLFIWACHYNPASKWTPIVA